VSTSKWVKIAALSVLSDPTQAFNKDVTECGQMRYGARGS